MARDNESYDSYPKVTVEETPYQNRVILDWTNTNHDYIVIQKSISQNVLDMLFEHTRYFKERNMIRRDRGQSPRQDMNPHNPDQTSNYLPPMCVSRGIPLSFNVGLKPSTVKRSVDGFRADPSHWGHIGQSLDVASSRMPGDGKMILYRTDVSVNEGQGPQFSWTHTQTDTNSFDDFLRFTSNVPNLADEDRALIVSLLERAQQDPPGLSEPQYVMRCVGSNSTKNRTERSAIFLRLPYYSIQKMDAAQSFRKSAYSTRSLLQYFYDLESTRHRDLQQVVRKSGVFPKGHVVHVSELWAVIVNFQFIITSAPIPLTDGASPSLEIMSPPTSQSSPPSNICVINPDKRVFFFPVELCKTFFEMRDRIFRYCLPEGQGRNDDNRGHELSRDFAMYTHDRVTQDRVQIRAEDWTELIASCASTLLRIDIDTFLAETAEERRGKDKKGKKFMFKDDKKKEEMERMFDATSPKSERSRQSLPETDKQDQSEQNHDSSEAGEQGGSERKRDFSETDESFQPEMDEDERGPNETEEATEDYKSDWNGGYLGKARYTGARHRLRQRTSVQYSFYSAGIVVNQTPSDNTYAHSNIYFEPTKPTFSWDKESVDQDILPNAADLEGQSDHSHRSTTSESLTGSSSASQTSSHASPPTINLEFPPVFTWRTKTTPLVEEIPISKPNSPLDNPSSDHLKSKVQSPNNPPEVLNVDEETIKILFAYINNELLDPTTGDSSSIYKQATKKSYFDVDQAITQRYAVSLPTLIAEHPEIVPDLLSPEMVPLKNVVSRLCRLFHFFAPLSYPCAVSDKFWGAVHDLLTTIPQYWDTSYTQELANQAGYQRMSKTFFIANLGRTEYYDLPDDVKLDELAFVVGECEKCMASHQYSTRSDALDHLLTHVSMVFPEQRSLSSSQSQWVMDFEDYLTHICRRNDLVVITDLKDFLRCLETMAAQIQHGVSANGEFDRNTYFIPKNLVGAFQDLLMLVVSGAYLVKTYHKRRETYTGSDPLSTFSMPSDLDVTDVGVEAEMSMEKAIRDIIMMTYTDEVSDVVTYEAAGPALVLAIIMGDIRCRDSQSNQVNLIEIYREHVRNLQFKASQNPQRRLLQEIYLVREELEIIQKASERQHLVLANYLSVIDPHSFTITTESRVSSFELEKKRLHKLIRQLNAELREISHLSVKLDSLANQTLSGVDVQQEDQGKAVLVFTIMTVVFTPLSFVTSYLGMNTADIRDMNSSQTLFWAISAPLTVGIITIVLFVAFQVDRIREAFDAFWTYDSTLAAKSGSAVLRGKGPKDRIQGPSGLSTPKNWVIRGWSSGRETELDDSIGV
ncbi:hypothetical protein PENSOL_c009G05499 [Penicillium solitum]|uniref:Uncharacterized protein n=1 Tax=Penicillium solitum TaxID=60172 RepID=A0A1V6RA68_9EURO|nr:uncharacterized protein PENSOL_c009G05499 [Penicillium solitum]OQD98435.1 hypothetical protein PENSOL_c009G05499 [Penicillium solitum]